MRIPSGFYLANLPSIGQFGRKMLPRNVKRICAVALIIFLFVCPGISYYAHTCLKGEQLKAIPDERHYL